VSSNRQLGLLASGGGAPRGHSGLGEWMRIRRGPGARGACKGNLSEELLQSKSILRFFDTKLIFNSIKSSKQSSKFFTKNSYLRRSSRDSSSGGCRGFGGSSREKTGSRRRNVIKEDIGVRGGTRGVRGGVREGLYAGVIPGGQRAP